MTSGYMSMETRSPTKNVFDYLTEPMFNTWAPSSTINHVVDELLPLTPFAQQAQQQACNQFQVCALIDCRLIDGSVRHEVRAGPSIVAVR